MSFNDKVQPALDVIGEALSTDPSDFHDHETWKFHGLGDLLAEATAADLRQQLGLNVSAETFARCPTVGSFRAFLRGEPVDPWEGIPKPKVPLSVVLKGQLDKASTVVFLFPDGSGAGTSYGTLPELGKAVCVVGLNSPFLRQAQQFTCSIEHMARLWLGEVQKLQPNGPYTLGGWSAGGYYAYEAAKLLTASGHKIDRLVLIDSPCRLFYEALPEQVVQQLTEKGLMGASGTKKAPEWLVQHFTSTVGSVDRYMPTPMGVQHVPTHVNMIWVREGLVDNVEQSGLRVDLSVKVTRFLLEPRPELRAEGWEKLVPGATFTYDYMTGNHFQITQPPHSDDLGRILKSLITT
ncbi:alpha/beta-hydrolase [Piedraia hortae CBS 480.64]|uniref:Alpha/beta-hydrolase n=1 Tax=Piedraia hortae CBS 480.64 TaxID=1314780 RepID=A0A6A7C3W5_9PEZI|nr:alpha/beta-hydrolase [Piedraia hortae CBS 480.64]